MCLHEEPENGGGCCFNSMGPLLGVLGRAFLLWMPKASELVELRVMARGEVVSGSSWITMRGTTLLLPHGTESVQHVVLICRRRSTGHQLPFQITHGNLQDNIMILKSGPGGVITDYFAILKGQ